jgi:DNA-nicking Smr family endonuclease
MDGKPGSRKRPLTAEEAELWAFAMRDALSMRRRERRRSEAARQADEAAANGAIPPPSPPATPSANPPPKPAIPTPPPPILPSRQPQPTKSPALAVYDEKERRRLSKNPELIDARLDLHGFRQREAHAALRSFLLSAVTRGHRHVLIITGKGGVAERHRDYLSEERGVLRRLVPQWLAEPELRGLVVSYTVSHIRHGGEGALYVRLRNLGGR